MTFFKSTALALTAALAASAAMAQGPGMPGAQFLGVWDLDGDGTATLAELQEMRGTVFAMFDANEDDILDAEEYVAFDEAREADMVNHEGPAPGRAIMQGVADGLALVPNDANEDGVVTRDEFIAATQSWLEMIDRDGDGTVTSADFGR